MSDHVKNLRSHGAYKWFESRKIKAFYNAVVTPTLRIGTQVLLQVNNSRLIWVTNNQIFGFISSGKKSKSKDTLSKLIHFIEGIVWMQCMNYLSFQALGIGKLRPNTLFLGYKSDWQKADPEDLEDYFNIIQ